MGIGVLGTRPGRRSAPQSLQGGLLGIGALGTRLEHKSGSRSGGRRRCSELGPRSRGERGACALQFRQRRIERPLPLPTTVPGNSELGLTTVCLPSRGPCPGHAALTGVSVIRAQWHVPGAHLRYSSSSANQRWRRRFRRRRQWTDVTSTPATTRWYRKRKDTRPPFPAGARKGRLAPIVIKVATCGEVASMEGRR